MGDRNLRPLSEQLRIDHECGDFGNALDGYAERAAALEQQAERLRAQRDALALLLGECADELETEIHCRLSGQTATLRLELPQRAKAKLREIGLPHGLPPNAQVTGRP